MTKLCNVFHDDYNKNFYICILVVLTFIALPFLILLLAISLSIFSMMFEQNHMKLEYLSTLSWMPFKVATRMEQSLVVTTLGGYLPCFLVVV